MDKKHYFILKYVKFLDIITIYLGENGSEEAG